MAEHIEREALMKDLCHSCDGWCDKVDCDCVNCKSEHRCDPVVEIADAPAADVVEVVRCKDCKYWDGEGRCEGIRNGLVLEYTDRLDYCSYGERKE